jgi:DNA-binding LacI/PurR family transcriptional regulator
VPRDLGVSGEGDTVLSRHSRPTLTSIRVQPRVLGEVAVRSLLSLVERSVLPANRLLPAELVRRASTRRSRQGRGRVQP